METKKKCKFGSVTRRTYNKRAKEFAERSTAAWKALTAFADKHGPKGRDAKRRYMDELTAVVDGYVNLNCAMRDWCQDRGVDAAEFFCDVENIGFTSLPASDEA